MQAIVYRRYSSDEQGDGSAQTLDAQLERCQSFAKAQGWTVVEVLTDEAKSAFTGDHLRADADLGRFISRLQDGEFAKGTILIADNLSRLSRRPVDEAMAWVHQVTGKGVEIGLADTREVFKPNPSLGDFLQTAIKFGVSHQASADKSDQTRRSKNTLWALAEQRKGKWVNLAGLLPRWLKRNATCDGWIVDEDMADTIVQIYKWSADGIGVNTIVNMLNARPDLPPFGRQKDYRSGVPAWSRTTVRQYLTSPIVEGDFRPNTGMFKGRVIHDFYPRIVDADTVARARADLKARRKVAGKGAGTGYTNLFAGITKCGLCGQRASLSTSVQKGKPYPYVRCEGSQEGRCTNKGGYAYRAFEATALDTFLDLALDDRFFEATGELGRSRVAKLKGRRRRRAALASVVAASFTLLSSAAPASDVNSSMDTYWSSSLGSANVTGPTAFQGQSAGYYTLGNMAVRTPQERREQNRCISSRQPSAARATPRAIHGLPTAGRSGR
ncbi:recombinase family protein [Brevundimonas sp. 'scallop']|uniref:recombinase family protein n=1 Tax=Brevundimonas sp. 'scallop' TaxID=2562582 RepID=UPI0013E207E5|nr:recombinase family protein [Brevundimonas sp. 'scallop']QIF82683.1 hypothetical protein E4341_13890 [Brevundimonas sp. 'scallop']